jgi:hypothetical protein
MSFQLAGIPFEPFASLFSLSDRALAEIGVYPPAQCQARMLFMPGRSG